MTEQNQPQKPGETSGSLLDQILSEPAREMTPEERAALEEKERADAAAAGKRPKRKLTWKEAWYRFLAFAFGASVIVASIVAYVILNPQQAAFLNQIFGIEIGEVARVLRVCMRAAFGTALAVEGGFWLYFLARCFLKSVKGFAKALAVFAAAVLAVLFFGVVIAWAAVEKELEAFINSNATIVLYDNDVYVQLDADADKAPAKIADSSKLIGPVTVRYDMDGYVRRIMREKSLVSIRGYEFDFDGDAKVDRDGQSILGNTFVWTYGRPADGHSFQPIGTIYGENPLRETVKISVQFPIISVSEEVKVSRSYEPDGGVRVAFDATQLMPRGNVEWYSQSGTGVKLESESYQFTPAEAFTSTKWICMSLYEGSKPTGKCSKYFVVRAEAGALIGGKLGLYADPVDYRKYRFSMEGLTFKQGTLASVKWYVGPTLVGTGPEVDHSFPGAGSYDVRAAVSDTTGNSKDFSRRVSVDEPIGIKKGYGLKMYDEAGAERLAGTYDESTESYLVSGIAFPQEVSLDAKEVKADGAGLKLVSAEWDLDGDGQYDSTGSLSAKLMLAEPKPYSLHVLYHFRQLSATGDRDRTASDSVVISASRLPFDVRLKVLPEGEYAPSKVLLDATASQATDGEIVRFEFEFGDGTLPSQSSKGQVIHSYANPGLYAVKVTAYKGDGTSKSAAKNFTLRRQQNVATIVTSVSRGRTGMPVNFDARSSRGSPTRISWKFGDGQAMEGESATHVYAASGSYDVSLEIQYSDGTVERDARKFEVLYAPAQQ